MITLELVLRYAISVLVINIKTKIPKKVKARHYRRESFKCKEGKKVRSRHHLGGKGKLRAKLELIPVSATWNNYEYIHSPLVGMLVHGRVTTSIKFAGTHLYTWVKRGTVRVKCLAPGTSSPARAQTRTARSGDECTNHKATMSHWSEPGNYQKPYILPVMWKLE